jgi:hypothetical protein
MHARVVFRPRLVLVDKKNGNPLPIDYQDCMNQIQKVSDAVIAIESNLRDITGFFKIRQGLQRQSE